MSESKVVELKMFGHRLLGKLTPLSWGGWDQLVKLQRQKALVVAECQSVGRREMGQHQSWC
jgi:hypothetical protein